MASGGGVNQAPPAPGPKTARLDIPTVIEQIAIGAITVGAATPVAPICEVLLQAKDIVDGATRNKEELDGLCSR